MCIEHKLYRVVTKWISGKLTFLPGKRRKFCLVLLILVEPPFCEMKQNEKKGKKEGKEEKKHQNLIFRIDLLCITLPKKMFLYQILKE